MAPRISVALATHDGGRFLGEQLDSLARQTLAPHELVVADDASRDGTRALVERFAAAAPFPVVLLAPAPHAGSTRTFERAMAACTGDAIALCDQDDRWHPDKLRTLADALDRTPEAAYVFSDGTLIDAAGRPAGASLWSTFGVDPALPSGPEERFVSLVVAPKLPGCTLAFRADRRSLVLPFPDGLVDGDHDFRHDAWTAALLEAVAPSVALAAPLVEYRLHAGQQIGTAGAAGEGRARRGAQRLLGTRRVDVRAELRARRAAAVLLRERLSARGDGERAARSLRQLDELIAHLDVRIALPARAPARAAPVLREWRRGRYRRYSNGAYSAVADVLRR